MGGHSAGDLLGFPGVALQPLLDSVLLITGTDHKKFNATAEMKDI